MEDPWDMSFVPNYIVRSSTDVFNQLWAPRTIDINKKLQKKVKILNANMYKNVPLFRESYDFDCPEGEEIKTLSN